MARQRAYIEFSKADSLAGIPCLGLGRTKEATAETPWLLACSSLILYFCGPQSRQTQEKAHEYELDLHFAGVFKIEQPAVVKCAILSQDSSDARGIPMSDTEHLLQHPWSQAPAAAKAGYDARNEALRQENARLKDLVVRLSAIIVQNAMQNAVHEKK